MISRFRRLRAALSAAAMALFVVVLLASSVAIYGAQDPTELSPFSSLEGHKGHNQLLVSQGSDPSPLASLATSHGTTATVPASYLPITLNLLPPTSVPAPNWLSYLNSFRTQASLAPLSEDGDWSRGDRLHGRYMVKNDYVGHYEDPANPWYTAEGQQAARSGNVFVTSWVNAPDETAIDFWMSAPFHAVAMLDPQLHTTGFGSYREATGLWQMGATLDVGRGLGELPAATAFPLPFPRNGGWTWLNSYRGGEWPDPLTSCPGYAAPTGPPVILQLGDGSLTPDVTGHFFTAGATPLDSCLFDETSYVNPSSGTQSTGRIILNNRDAVVLMPRDPLVLGQTYTAGVTVDGLLIEWRFTVAAPAMNLQMPAGARYTIR